jgi:hypothetical protein
VEDVGKPLQPERALPQRLDRVLLLEPQGGRRAQRLRGLDPLQLLLGEPREPRVEVGGLEPRRRQQRGELLADRVARARDLAHLAHVALVAAPLAAPGAAGDPDDEHDDEHDDPGHERDETQQALRGDVRRPARTARPEAVNALGRRTLPGLGLLEEVELEVGFALGHTGPLRAI